MLGTLYHVRVYACVHICVRVYAFVFVYVSTCIVVTPSVVRLTRCGTRTISSIQRTISNISHVSHIHIYMYILSTTASD